MANHSWKPAGPLSDREPKIDLASLIPARSAWRAAEKKLSLDDPKRLNEIKRRLIRRLIVETGLVENLYELGGAMAEKLVADGFIVTEALSRSTNLEPALLIAVLQNQEAAFAHVVEIAEQRRPLTKQAIQQIHATMMRHQDAVAVTDALGQKRAVPLLKGEFKKVSNNLILPDGGLHEFCPPLKVEQEIDFLLQGLVASRTGDPILAAAWLHYHLYQTHPFQTGNGRVVRAATAHVMLKAGLLPPIVSYDDRVEYRTCMIAADGGDLAPLTSLFARAERNAIGQALDDMTNSEVELMHQPT